MTDKNIAKSPTKVNTDWKLSFNNHNKIKQRCGQKSKYKIMSTIIFVLYKVTVGKLRREKEKENRKIIIT